MYENEKDMRIRSEFRHQMRVGFTNPAPPHLVPKISFWQFSFFYLFLPSFPHFSNFPLLLFCPNSRGALAQKVPGKNILLWLDKTIYTDGIKEYWEAKWIILHILNDTVYNMVFILDGNSGIGAHVMTITVILSVNLSFDGVGVDSIQLL